MVPFSGDDPRWRWAALAWLTSVSCVWIAASVIAMPSPTWDNAEALVWASFPQLGYYKHPPLPSWLLYGLVQIFGHQVWLTYAAGMTCVSVGLFLTFRWLNRSLPGPQAFIAIVLATLIAYHSWRGVYFNHNVVQIPFIAWSCLAFARLRSGGGFGDVVSLGIAAGLAMLTKYSAVLLFATFAIVLVIDFWRDGQSNLGVWLRSSIAALIALLVFSPHLMWLIQHEWMPFEYARQASLGMAPRSFGGQTAELLNWIATQTGRIAPMVMVAGSYWVWSRRHHGSRRALGFGEASTASGVSAGQKEARLFWAVAVGPVLMMVVLLVMGVNVEGHWPSMYFLPWGAVIWILMTRRRPIMAKQMDSGVAAKPFVFMAVLMHGVLALAIIAGERYASDYRGLSKRSNYPVDALGEALRSIQIQQGSARFDLIASDTWTAAMAGLSLGHGAFPAVLIDGEFGPKSRAPWVRAADIDACGMLVLIDRSGASRRTPAPTEAQLAWLELAQAKGQIQLSWGRSGEKLELEWGLIPAGNAGTAREQALGVKDDGTIYDLTGRKACGRL